MSGEYGTCVLCGEYVCNYTHTCKESKMKTDEQVKFVNVSERYLENIQVASAELSRRLNERSAELAEKDTEIEVYKKHTDSMYVASRGQITQLEQKLAVAVEALEFYDGALRQNWAIDFSRLSKVAIEALSQLKEQGRCDCHNIYPAICDACKDEEKGVVK